LADVVDVGDVPKAAVSACSKQSVAGVIRAGDFPGNKRIIDEVAVDTLHNRITDGERVDIRRCKI
jgi:hypothetical protein